MITQIESPVVVTIVVTSTRLTPDESTAAGAAGLNRDTAIE
jgi:hypothetical protein